MAILQRTLTTGSIWIGSGSASTEWTGYTSSHNTSLAIYIGGEKRLSYDNQSTNNSILSITTHSSIGSREFVSGFGGQGFKVEPLSLSEYPFSNSWRGTFDELWVRGTMNVYEFVINQIRATNGSLWVSDAGKVTSASYADNKLALTFYTDSAGYIMPFVPGDIIRSKRWMPHGTNSIQTNWDFMGIVQASEYGSGKCSLDVSSGNYYLAPESYTLQTFVKDVASYGAEFVRIGNTSTASRKGAIYLTSNDQGGPFLDVYDGVSSIGNFTGSYTGSAGATLSVNPNLYDEQSADDRRLKLRLGQLNGITTDEFGGQLSGYGLYADNAYLRGWIHANKGGQIAGWTITNSYLSSGDISIATSIDADDKIYRGIFIKNPEASWDNLVYGDKEFPLYIGQHSESGVGWEPVRISLGDALRFQNGSLYISGTVSAVAGDIANWSIGTNKLYSGDVTISSLDTNKYFGIGSADYNTDGIYIGSNSVGGRQLSLKNDVTGLFWDGSNLGISTSKFTLSQGNITAQGGSIAGWTIADTQISKSLEASAVSIRSETSSEWNYVGRSGYEFDISGSTNRLITIKQAYCGASKDGGEKDNPWLGIQNTSSITKISYLGNESAVSIIYTSSGANSGKPIVAWNVDYYDIPPYQTITLGTKYILFDYIGSGLGTETTHYLALGIYSGSSPTALKTSSYIMPESGGIGYSDIYLSYTNTNNYTQQLKVLLVPSMLATSGSTFYYGITVSQMAIATSTGYTELNPEGLLVYASPTNYLKVTTHKSGTSTQSYAIVSVDELWVDGKQITSDGSSGGSGGGTSPTDLDGTTKNKFTVNMQGDANNSVLSLAKGTTDGSLTYDGSQFITSVPIQYNGSGSLLGYNNLSSGLDGLYDYLYTAFSWTIPAATTTITGSISSSTWTFTHNRNNLNPVSLSITMSYQTMSTTGIADPTAGNFILISGSTFPVTTRTFTYNDIHNDKCLKLQLNSVDERGISSTVVTAYRYVRNYYYLGTISDTASALNNPQMWTSSTGWAYKRADALVNSRAISSMTPTAGGYLMIAYPQRCNPSTRSASLPSLILGGFTTQWRDLGIYTTRSGVNITNIAGYTEPYQICWLANAVSTTTTIVIGS